MPVPRYAISYTPPPDSPLARFGAAVLGYDCFYRTEVPRRRIDGIDPSVLTLATVEPRRYGFHGLLVGPFRLKDQSEAALIEGYLPAQLSDDDMDVIVESAIAKLGAKSLKDMGQVMREAMALAAGRAEGKRVQERVRARLSE